MTKKSLAFFVHLVSLLKAALTAKHPIDMSFPLPDVLVKAIVTVINEGPKLTNARRKLQMAKLKRMTVQFKSQEIELHKRLRPELETVLASKNLLLWQQLMQMTGYDDPSLFDEVAVVSDSQELQVLPTSFPMVFKQRPSRSSN